MSFRLEWVPPPQPAVISVQGLPLYWIRERGSLAHVALVWEAPALRKYPAGLRRLLLRLLAEENRFYPQGELNRRLRRLGWHWSWEATPDAILLQAEGLAENLSSALELVRIAVEAPILGGPAVQAHLERLVEAQERAWANPSYRADAYLKKALWSKSYALGDVASPGDLRAMDLAALPDFYERFFRRGLRALVLSAPVLPSGIAKWADESGPLSYALPLPTWSPHTYSEGFSAAKQVSLRLAAPWVRSVHPLYGLYRLALLRLGGYFGSQLMRTVREEKGLTYGIYARVEETWAGSALYISAEVRQDQATAALESISEEVAQWAKQPFPTPQLLLECRNYLLAQLMPETAGDWVRRLSHLIARGRSVELYAQQAMQISAADTRPWPELELPATLPIQVAVGPEALTFAPACA